jgi:hypothetical protein
MRHLLGAALLLLLSSRSCHGLSSVPRPSSLKLYYFDFPFWRAEIVRLSLFLGDVPFEDIRDQKASDLKAAGKLTFGAVPVLEVDGKILSQTQAMATYAAKLAGIQPADPWLQAKIDECINVRRHILLYALPRARLPAAPPPPAPAAASSPSEGAI